LCFEWSRGEVKNDGKVFLFEKSFKKDYLFRNFSDLPLIFVSEIIRKVFINLLKMI